MPNAAVSYVSKFVYSFNNPHHPRYWIRVMASELLEVVLLVVSLITETPPNNVALGILIAALALQTGQLPFLALMGRHYHVSEMSSYRQFKKYENAANSSENEIEISETDARDLIACYVDPHTRAHGWVEIKRKSRKKTSVSMQFLELFVPVQAFSGFFKKAAKNEIDTTDLRYEDFEFPHQRPSKRTTLIHMSEFVADWLTFAASMLLFQVGRPQAFTTWVQGFLAIFNLVFLTKSILTSYLDNYDTPFKPLKYVLYFNLLATYVGFFSLLMGVFAALSVLYEKEIFVEQVSQNSKLTPEVRTGLIWIGALSGLALGIGILWYCTFSCLVCFKCLWIKKERTAKEKAQMAVLAAAGGDLKPSIAGAVGAVKQIDAALGKDNKLASKGVNMALKAAGV